MNEASPKIVFAGPVGAGKTAAIQSISDAPPVSTEVPWLGDPIPGKITTTVALDFSTVLLDDGTDLQVFGLPGQEHLAFMRPIVLTGALGVVLVLNGTDRNVAGECQLWVAALHEIAPDLPVVIGITQTDGDPDFDLSPIRAAVRRERNPIPVLTFDARDREQTSQIVRSLLTLLLV